MPGIGCGSNQDGPQLPVQAIIAIGRIVQKRNRVIIPVLLSLHRHPILIRLFISVRGFFGDGAWNSGEDFRIGERRWNFKLQDLFMLLPIDDKVQLDYVRLRKGEDIDGDFRLLPTQPLARDFEHRPIFHHFGRDQLGPTYLLAELIDSMRPGIARISNDDQSNLRREQFSAPLCFERRDPERVF